MEHKQDEPVRAYLLGTLDDREADALEERYFTKRELFGYLRTKETELIEDYLNNRLLAPDRQRFEQRYLKVPELVRRVEEVRSAAVKRPAPRTASMRQWVSLAAAACLLLVAAAVVYRRPAVPKPGAAGVGASSEAPPLSVRLSPGVEMGGRSRNVVFQIPARGFVRAALELPGRPVQGALKASLFEIQADAHRLELWASQPAVPSKINGGSSLSIDIPVRVLHPGDFAVSVTSAAGEVLETYLFRADAATN